LHILCTNIQPVLSKYANKGANILTLPPCLDPIFHTFPHHLEKKSLLQNRCTCLIAHYAEEARIELTRIILQKVPLPGSHRIRPCLVIEGINGIPSISHIAYPILLLNEVSKVVFRSHPNRQSHAHAHHSPSVQKAVVLHIDVSPYHIALGALQGAVQPRYYELYYQVSSLPSRLLVSIKFFRKKPFVSTPKDQYLVLTLARLEHLPSPGTFYKLLGCCRLYFGICFHNVFSLAVDL
jgi:hypothetical protein